MCRFRRMKVHRGFSAIFVQTFIAVIINSKSKHEYVSEKIFKKMKNCNQTEIWN